MKDFGPSRTSKVKNNFLHDTSYFLWVSGLQRPARCISLRYRGHRTVGNHSTANNKNYLGRVIQMNERIC